MPIPVVEMRLPKRPALHTQTSKREEGDPMMKSPTMKSALLLMFACTALSLVSYGQNDKSQPEAYTGVALGTGGAASGKSIQFDFKITAYTTDDELNNFASLLKEQGTDALRRALEKENKGRLNPVGTVGIDIAVARKRQQGADTIITIVTARNMSLRELYNNGRSVSYPFGYLQVKLNDKGEGAGQFMAAAKIRFDKKSGKYEIESYGNQYIKAVNVRPSK
jgi:hypothetical protein